jgi:uncharacterized protein (TIGR02996 family)
MHSREGFLETILAAPDDDAPRLVFSDWLEDHGDLARAEFIRVQCELVRLSPRERRHCELAWRAETLLVENRARWVAELPGLDGVEWLEFERGFVSTVRVPDLRVLFRHDKVIAAAAPVFRVELARLDETKTPRPENAVLWLRILRLSDRGDSFQTRESTASLLDGVTELEVVHLREYHDTRWLTSQSDLPLLQQIRFQGSHTAGQAIAAWVIDNPSIQPTRLELGTRFVDYNSGYFEDPTIGPEGAVVLAQAANLANLEGLNLNRQRIGREGFQAIVSSSTLGRLRELELRAAQTTDVTALESTRGGPLVRLDLSLNAIGERGARSLGKSHRLAQLERLDLDTCEINPAGVEALTRAKFWQTLRMLDLSRNPLGVAGAKVLADAPEPANLHTLTLVDCDLDADAARVLASIPWLRNLLALDLSRNALEAGGLAHLGRLAGGSLRQLTLARTGADEPAASRLAPLLPQLVHLDLADNPLTNAGLTSLLARAPAPNLLVLKLPRCGLSQPGLTALFRDKLCPRLHLLDVSGNSLSTRMVELLVRSPLVTTVGELKLTNCNLDQKAAELIADAATLTNCGVINLRDNDLGEAGLLALARSKHLAGVSLLLSGTPWRFPEASRKLLEDRFGRHWQYQMDEEEQEQEDEEFADDYDEEDDLDDA